MSFPVVLIYCIKSDFVYDSANNSEEDQLFFGANMAVTLKYYTFQDQT